MTGSHPQALEHEKIKIEPVNGASLKLRYGDQQLNLLVFLQQTFAASEAEEDPSKPFTENRCR